MRFLVRSGTEAEARELLRTAETVPGVSPTCSARAFRVTTCGLSRSEFSVRPAMRVSGCGSIDPDCLNICISRENYRRKAELVKANPCAYGGYRYAQRQPNIVVWVIALINPEGCRHTRTSLLVS